MSDDQKQGLMLLDANNYFILTLREQLDYYNQNVQSEFRKSVDELTNHAEILAKDDDCESSEQCQVKGCGQ